MAAKDVNLLDDDDADDDAPLDDYGDDDLEGSIGGSSSSSGKKGGGLIRTIIMALVGLLILGGVGWGGYQFWWIPKQEKEIRDIAMKKRQEELKKTNQEKRKKARAQRKKELAELQKMQAAAEEKVKETASEEPEAPSEEPAKPSPAPEKPQVAKSPAPPAAKKRPAPKAETAPPPAPDKKMEKPRAAERRAAPTAKLRRPASGGAMGQKPTAAKKQKSPSRAAKRPSGRYFSVQVATCRTDGCVNSFVKKLQAKGYKPFVGGGGNSGSSTLTEVLLGDFTKRQDALSLASRARGKKIRVSMYRSGGKWFVSAGSYADLEDAAQRLDRVEDSGLSAKLSPRTIASKKSRLRTVRIGRLPNRRDAIAMQAKITRAGFRGSYVVRRK
ncbi:MAG: SPOR domain-containing protein [bacterium]